ncbi:hypothetical protein ABVT39_000722 [Epinephelus coioides]
MDSAFDNLDAAGFLEIWQHFDADDNGYIEDKELDDFFRHMMKRLGPQEKVTEERVQRLKQRFMSAYDVTADGKLQIHELANMILPEDENFLLIFRREAPLDNSVDFMKIWRKYDVDCSGYISARELKAFLKDLFQQHHKEVSSDKLDEYTDTMVVIQFIHTQTNAHSRAKVPTFSSFKIGFLVWYQCTLPCKVLTVKCMLNLLLCLPSMQLDSDCEQEAL